MRPNSHRKLRVRIFVEERNGGMDWVPYKTLIGYNVANRPILGRLWEAVYCVKEFASKAEALEEAIPPGVDQDLGTVRSCRRCGDCMGSDPRAGS
jgi:hypothetical protein